MNRTIAIVVAVMAVVTSNQHAHAGKKAYLGAQVAAGKQVSMDRIDHSTWDAILHKYVDENGMVNYRALKASSGDTQALDGYLRTLSAANVQTKASAQAKLAFWINAYNAVTVRGILREYPTKSIRDHTAKLYGYNIWKDLQLYVGGKPYSLEQIEHQILRKMREPRIHFAIVCASIGCPRLLNEAYVPSRIQEQLETNARDFFARSQNFRYDQGRQRIYLSAILDWFGEDFGSNRAEQLRKIAGWLPTKAAQQAAKQNSVQVSFLDYNWNLNEQTVVRSARR